MAAYIKTKSESIIRIFNNVAADAKLDQSILLCIQMRAANNFISDVHKCFEGLQMIETNLNHSIPIKFVAELPYIEMRPITKAEFNNPKIPHVLMTPEGDWNPRKYDDECDMDKSMRAIPATSTSITDMFNKWNGDLNIACVITESQSCHNLGSESTTNTPKATTSLVSNIISLFWKRDQVPKVSPNRANNRDQVSNRVPNCETELTPNPTLTSPTSNPANKPP